MREFSHRQCEYHSYCINIKTVILNKAHFGGGVYKHMSEHTPNRKQAGRVKVTQRLNASSPTEDKDRRLVRRSHRKARKRSERLRDAVLPTMGATNGYLTNPLSCYSAFPVISPSMYPPYNPPGVPPYMPLAFQYPVLPPILQSAAYERDDHER